MDDSLKTARNAGAEPWINEAALASTYGDHIASIAARHDQALERAGASHAVVFSGAAKLKFLDDNDYAFQANPHFVGWLPLTQHPSCYLVYTPGEKPVLVFYQEKDYWHAPPSPPEGYWTDAFDVRIVHEADAIAAELPAKREQCVLIGDVTDPAQAMGIERVNPSSILNALHYARGQKTPYELECMRAASRRAVAGHRAAEQAFRGGASEFDIHLDYCRAVSHTENELPYGNIIALNEHAAILHYQHQSRTPPEVARSFLIDAGASVNGYAADITRTHAARDDAFNHLVERMDELQRAIIGEVRAGVDYTALHIATHTRIATLLKELDLAHGSDEALITEGVTAAFFPHGLGHLLGIQVHDVGGFMADDTGNTIDRPPGHPFLRLTRTLEPDQVLTIEPGLYCIDQLLEGLRGTPGEKLVNADTVKRLRPYGGVRIEDNVRVLEDGTENFTRDAFAAA